MEDKMDKMAQEVSDLTDIVWTDLEWKVLKKIYKNLDMLMFFVSELNAVDKVTAIGDAYKDIRKIILSQHYVNLFEEEEEKKEGEA